jgi:hypothetical protein
VAELRGHLADEHREDEEKVVIQMQPCGSDGKLVLRQILGPNAFLTV